MTADPEPEIGMHSTPPSVMLPTNPPKYLPVSYGGCSCTCHYWYNTHHIAPCCYPPAPTEEATVPINAVTTAQADFPAPIPVTRLLEFLSELPPSAAIEITEISGGSQRDPYTTGYSITAKWPWRS